jgi:hypothetical protein
MNITPEVQEALNEIERFADLVIEECAKTLDDLDISTLSITHSDSTRKHCAAALRALKSKP